MSEPSTEPRFKAGTPHADGRLAIEERRAQVAALVLSHVSYQRIATMLGVSKTTVFKDVQLLRRQYRVRAGADYETYVAAELAKLDMLEQAWMPKALPFHPLAKPEDASAAERAAVIILRIHERRGRLTGHDQPVKVDMTVTETSRLDAEIAAMLGQMSEHEIER